ncbi:50S ribosomal protein L17 [Opitutia bacterium ISCC 51]|nr:50S ribosomal protein L17 [Opitutae bacterium ISCC 51]QXD27876.1 50S ribosomal protein L17 [Opitutae bacterium ISCC 52]
MRHLKHRHELGVKKAHRPALMANLALALIKEGRIKTTLAKAKALRPFIEKIITLAKNGTLADRRLAASRLRNKEAVQLLFNEKVEEFKDRQGGYTRIYKIGTRVGDAAEMALIELIPAADEGYGKKRKKKAKKTAKKAAEEKAVEEVAEEVVAEEPAAEVEETPAAEAEEAPEAKAEAEEALAAEEDAADEEEETKK